MSNTQSSQQAVRATLKAYHEQVSAQVQEGKARLEQLEAKARQKQAKAEIADIVGLQSARQNIDRKLQDLKGTHAEHMARAKADIDADVATFKASVDDFASKFKASTAKK